MQKAQGAMKLKISRSGIFRFAATELHKYFPFGKLKPQRSCSIWGMKSRSAHSPQRQGTALLNQLNDLLHHRIARKTMLWRGLQLAGSEGSSVANCCKRLRVAARPDSSANCSQCLASSSLNLYLLPIFMAILGVSWGRSP